MYNSKIFEVLWTSINPQQILISEGINPQATPWEPGETSAGLRERRGLGAFGPQPFAARRIEEGGDRAGWGEELTETCGCTTMYCIPIYIYIKHTYIQAWTCACICIIIYSMWLYMHTHICIYIYSIYIYVHTHIYIYLYIHIQKKHDTPGCMFY